MRAEELIEAVKSYDKKADADALNRAYLFAQKMHYDQQRESGEKYIIHPIAVAQILLEYRLDGNSIIAALLHDTVEDTPASYDSIEALFGKDVANLVQGLTKLEKFQLVSEDAGQAENFRKLILASSRDVRILLIKLADRLHNMRTLKYSSPEKQLRVSKETMDIYVPLAERIGMHLVKNELEDLAFRYINPIAYENITTQLNLLNKKHHVRLGAIIQKIECILSESHIKAVVTGRQKMPYSLWKKLQQHNGALEHIFDIVGFRIVVKTIPQCYQVLGLIHQNFRMIPGRFKDYISTPKDNGYRSLQTSVLCPNQRAIEVQIRTQEMAYESDFGVAAHWQYKQGVPYAGKKYKWMQELLALMQNTKNPMEFLNRTRMHLYQDKIFCFAKDGRLLSMPKGATILDFAYNVSDKLGNHFARAKMNGRIVGAGDPLVEGAQIEIITSGKSEPKAEWKTSVKTPYAKSCIEEWLLNKKFDEEKNKGAEILQRYATKKHIHLDPQMLNDLAKKTRYRSLPVLYAALGKGSVKPYQIMDKLHLWPQMGLFEKTLALFKRKTQNTLPPILGLEASDAFVLGNCCQPSVGNAIVGIRENHQVVIHRRECVQLAKYIKQPDKWVNVEWNITKKGHNSLPARLRVVWKTNPKTMAEIVTLFAKNEAELCRVNTITQDSKKTEVIIDINVEDDDHLLDVLDCLRKNPKIFSAFQVKGIE
ncbi:MAG: bifunctional (p)ppGpp synthetase/guanosine-3',5'-bis(diphosphate) 3'-pyrophosphohydrolase [Alphaproteobacteria bacterium]|nr:bifunctional (p)ppGpp synthetase/guanosine-3',5'-bis(diphosphate) 3'-pyrophosphohydrolase [Alphaproteobacteria bacterium]